MNNNTINLNTKINNKEMVKGIKKIGGIVLFFVVILLVISSATFTVDEHEQAVVSRFGSVKRIIIDENNTFISDYPETLSVEGAELESATVQVGKGLFFKVPFIDKVEKYDSWLYTYVTTPQNVNTNEKKQYEVTMYAQWRIANPGLFALTLKNTSGASLFLDNMIYPEIVQKINNTSSDDFITNKDLWNETMADAMININEKIRESGIEVIDMQVHRTILPDTNLQSTYDKMVANREKIAQQHRSQGEAYYTKQVSSADREARELVAGAILESEQIIGEGEAEALEIYANAYSVDPDFYAYWRSLQALETSLEYNTTLVLDDTHPLWSDLLDMVTWGSSSEN